MIIFRALCLLLLLAGLMPAADPVPRPIPAFPAAPSWAAAAGDDRHGRWADLVVAGAHQRLRWIEPGTFIMGCTQAERDEAIRSGAQPEWVADEVPHQVTLTRGFWLGDSACTRELWQAVMGSAVVRGHDDPRGPVDSVSYEEAQWFLAVLNGLAHARFALPTEAQREYACRAGTLGAYAGAKLEALAWFRGNSGAHAHPVMRKEPNPWGLYDMHGNVWEWCADWYAAYPSMEVSDPRGPDLGIYRVRRGGSWGSDAGSCRSAYRGGDVPTVRSAALGFRIAAPADAAADGDASSSGIAAADGVAGDAGPLRTRP